MEGYKPDAQVDIPIPMDLFREFEMEPRFVLRHPWVIGIPVPEIFLKDDLLKMVEQAGYQVMLVPKEPGR